jgi:hypothetical protein
MPASVQNAVATTVMPFFLARQFTASREVLVQENVYRDGERQLGLLAHTSLKTFITLLATTAIQLTAMREFYLARKGGLEPFYFYYGPECGYRHDPSGQASEGRYIVIFLNPWEQVIGMGRSEASIQLIERN